MNGQYLGQPLGHHPGNGTEIENSVNAKTFCMIVSCE